MRTTPLFGSLFGRLPRVSSPGRALCWAPLALVLMLTLAACGNTVGDASAAVVVNGVSIPLDVVQQRFDAVRRDPELAQQLAADQDGSFMARVQARLLTQMIQAELLSQAAAEIGIEITEADITDELNAIIEQVGGQEAFDKIVADNNLSDDEVRSQIRDLVVERKVQEHLSAQNEITDADVAAYYEENKNTRYDRVRASHILVETQEEAADLLRQVRGGADFAELAATASKDTGSAAQGGDLGEFTRGRLVPEFEEAAFNANVGEVVGPIQTQFGWHIIKITSHVQPSLDEVSAEIRAELEAQVAAEAQTAFREKHFADADIRVNPRLGKWNAQTGEVDAVGPLGAVETIAPDLGQLPLEQVAPGQEQGHEHGAHDHGASGQES